MSAQTLLDWALQTGLSVSILILFVLLIRTPVARKLGANAAYALWSLPILRLFLPALPVLPAPAPTPVLPVPPNTALIEHAITVPALVTRSETTISTATILLGVWVSGAIIWLIWQGVRQNQFSSQLKQTTDKAPRGILRTAAPLAADLGLSGMPEFRLSPSGAGPLVSGLLHPVIVLPNDFETEFTRDQQVHALTHELSHIQRRDLWISAAALVFRALNWPNPLVHLAAPLFRADQEAACDARVIAILGDNRSTRTAYADTLIKSAKLSKSKAQFQPAMAPLGLTISNPLKERLMILKSNPSKRRGLRLALAGTAGLALLATAPLTTAQTPTPPDVPETIVTAKSVDKQVMKWVTKENGVEVKKHIEIITEDGVTTAWEIDALGNRIQVPADSIDMPMDLGAAGDGKMRIMMKHLGDGEAMSEQDIEVMIAEAMEDMDIEDLAGPDGERKVIVKRFGSGTDVDIDVEKLIEGHAGDGKKVIIMESHGMVDLSSDGEKSFMFHSGDQMKSEPGMMVGVASKMLDGVNTEGLDNHARAKVEAAQQALKEAQEALAAAE